MSRNSTPPESARPTGHQDHFLSRLDRLALPEVELALGFYRDHELVRFMLGELKLPEGAERVALSLDDPRAGPFVIVTREGRFVTCLGRGMKPGHCPIVTRAQVDALSARHERLAAARALEAKGGGLKGIFVHLLHAGDAVSREEMAVACAMLPLYEGLITTMVVDVAKTISAGRLSIMAVMRRQGPPSRRERAAMHATWRLLWMMGHLALLSAQTLRPKLDAILGRNREEAATMFSGALFREWTLCGAARGIWAAARLGKQLLPGYKDAYERAESLLGFAEMHLVLALLGLRHARLRAEAQKALGTVPGFFVGNARFEERARSMVQRVAAAYEEPEVLRALHLRRGQEEVVARTRHLGAGSALKPSRPEEVPEAVAMAMAANLEAEFVKDEAMLLHLYAMLPWLSRAQAEDFYLPRQWLEAVWRPWTPARTRAMLAGLEAQEMMLREAVRAHAPPTRNGPCPCGSGKKYKKCCGA